MELVVLHKLAGNLSLSRCHKHRKSGNKYQMDLTADGNFQIAWDLWKESMYKFWALKTVTACFLTTEELSV
jgi:hypothetical protein